MVNKQDVIHFINAALHRIIAVEDAMGQTIRMQLTQPSSLAFVDLQKHVIASARADLVLGLRALMLPDDDEDCLLVQIFGPDICEDCEFLNEDAVASMFQKPLKEAWEQAKANGVSFENFVRRLHDMGRVA